MGETTAMLESRLENEWQSPGQTIALRSEMLNELVRMSRRLDAIESHPSSVPPAISKLELAESRLRLAVEVLTFLLNAVHKECGCNTIANPCPRCRIRAALAKIEAKP